MRQGDGAVGRNVEAEDQLFEVRPMILVVMWLTTLQQLCYLGEYVA
jgi:hypothetical protein